MTGAEDKATVATDPSADSGTEDGRRGLSLTASPLPFPFRIRYQSGKRKRSSDGAVVVGSKDFEELLTLPLGILGSRWTKTEGFTEVSDGKYWNWFLFPNEKVPA